MFKRILQAGLVASVLAVGAHVEVEAQLRGPAADFTGFTGSLDLDGGPLGSFLGSESGHMSALAPFVDHFVFSLRTSRPSTLYYFGSGSVAWDYGAGAVSSSAPEEPGAYVPEVVAVPEAATILLILTGLVAMAVVAMRRKEEMLS